MQPTEGPTNDNWEGPPPKWEDTPLGKRVMLCVSLVVIVVIFGSAALFLDAAHWRGIGVTFGIGCLFIVVAAIYRLIVYGRA